MLKTFISCDNGSDEKVYMFSASSWSKVMMMMMMVINLSVLDFRNKVI